MNNNPTILLAEDDLNDAHFFADSFSKVSPGHKLLHVTTGLECISTLKGKILPDFIFLDLTMPVITGIECLKYIKDNNRLENIPVVIYSTSYYLKVIDCAYKNGAHYYIVKPPSYRQLTQTLDAVMSRLTENAAIPGKNRFVVKMQPTTELNAA